MLLLTRAAARCESEGTKQIRTQHDLLDHDAPLSREGISHVRVVLRTVGIYRRAKGLQYYGITLPDRFTIHVVTLRVSFLNARMSCCYYWDLSCSSLIRVCRVSYVSAHVSTRLTYVSTVLHVLQPVHIVLHVSQPTSIVSHICLPSTSRVLLHDSHADYFRHVSYVSQLESHTCLKCL